MTDLRQILLQPDTPAQRQYEAVRARLIDGEPNATVAARFGYTPGSLANLCCQARKDPAAFKRRVFPPPSDRPAPTPQSNAAATRQRRVLALREQGLSVKDIAQRLRAAGESWGTSTIARDLRAAGLAKLPRRDPATRHAAAHPTRVAAADCRAVDWAPRQFQTAFGGLFLFAGPLATLLPDARLRECRMPGTAAIPAGHALRSLLGLKLYGIGRPSHAMAETMDAGLALFAGLNTVPKKSLLSAYSARTRPAAVRALMQACHEPAYALGLPLGDTFDLDFHTIPSHGEKALLDKHYVSKRSRRQRGVLAFLARDADADVFCYADATLSPAAAAGAALDFAHYWRARTGDWPRELVFDSGLTTYPRLAELDRLGIGFITLRRRSPSLKEAARTAPAADWRRVRLSNVGRTYRTPLVLETRTILPGWQVPVRQIAVRELGHADPIFLLTNQSDPVGQLIDRYARRMVIENAIARAIDFFHMDALSATVPLRVNLDLQLTLLADMLYRQLGQRVGGKYAPAAARTLFRDLVRGRATVTIQPARVHVRLHPRACHPHLLAAGFDGPVGPIPWWENRVLHLEIG